MCPQLNSQHWPHPQPLSAEWLTHSPSEVLLDTLAPGCPLVIAFGAWNPQGPGRFEWLASLRRVQSLVGPFNTLLVRDPHNQWYHTRRGRAG